MGVPGLWKLLESSRRKSNLEEFRGKRMAIDMNIWLHQALKSRGTTYSKNPNFYLSILFRRICKLLYYGIRPVFVFDGAVPELKQMTMSLRRETRRNLQDSSDKARQKLLKRILKRIAEGSQQKNKKHVKDLSAEFVQRLKNSQDGRRAEMDKALFGHPPAQPVIDSRTAFFHIDSKSSELEATQQASLALARDFLVSFHELIQFLLTFRMPLSFYKRLLGFVSKQDGCADQETVDLESDVFNSLPLETQLHAIIILQQKLKSKLGDIISDKPSADMFSLQQINKIILRRNLSLRLADLQRRLSKQAMLNVRSEINVPDLEKFAANDAVDFQAARIASQDEGYVFLLKHSSEAINKRESMERLDRLIHLPKSGTGESSGACITSEEDGFKAFQSLHEPEEDGSIGVLDMNDNSNCYRSLPESSHTPEEEEEEEEEEKGAEVSAETTSSFVKISPLKRMNCAMEDAFSIPYDSIFSKKIFKESTSLQTSTSPPEMSPTTSTNTPILLDSRESISAEATPSNSLVDVHDVEKGKVFYSLYNVSLNENDRLANFPLLNSTNSKCLQNDDNDDDDDDDDDASFIDVEPYESEVSSVDVVRDLAEVSPGRLATALSEDEDTDKCSNNDGGNSETSSDESDIKVEILSNSYGAVDIVKVEGSVNEKTRQSAWGLFASNDDEDDFELDDDFLRAEADRLERQAQQTTSDCVSEAKSLLHTFGIPFIISPEEAEAQCSRLQQLGLVDVVASDDSDVWLFGAKLICRHLFGGQRSKKSDETSTYSAREIQSVLGLDRSQLLRIALLCGSDYTRGVPNVGPVKAMEILAEFASVTSVFSDDVSSTSDELSAASVVKPLLNFKEAINSLSNSTPSSAVSSSKKSSISNWRSINLPKDFPNPAVVEGYLRPNVNSSIAEFRWRSPDLPALLQFAVDRLGWLRETSKSTLESVLNSFQACQDELSPSKRITLITDYFTQSPAKLGQSVGANVSKKKRTSRLNAASSRLRYAAEFADILQKDNGDWLIDVDNSTLSSPAVLSTKQAHHQSGAIRRKGHLGALGMKSTDRLKPIAQNRRCRRSARKPNTSASQADLT